MSKTILITGAGSGFGKGAAIALVARGYHVIATTETSDQASELAKEAPQLQVEKVDITNSADIAKISDWDIDVLINNAGYGQTGPMSDVPNDRLRKVFEVNVFGTVAATQAALPRMSAKGAGRIIIMSSIAGVVELSQLQVSDHTQCQSTHSRQWAKQCAPSSHHKALMYASSTLRHTTPASMTAWLIPCGNGLMTPPSTRLLRRFTR